MNKTVASAPCTESVLLGMDDPVPGDAESGIYGESPCLPHETECMVLRALLSMPDVHFSSLEVHRMENGVCLSGIACVNEDAVRPQMQIERIAGAAAGVTNVLNRLVIQRGSFR